MQPLAALLLLGAGSTAASLSGPWVANGARLELKQDGATVVGTLATPGGPCAVKVGTELLRGSLLDDSLAAQVRLCLLRETCGNTPATALAMLLVTTQLTGGVHTDAVCAADVRALTLRKPGAAKALAAPLANERLSHTPVPPRRLKTETPVVAASAETRAEQTRIAARARLEIRTPAQQSASQLPPARVASAEPAANVSAPSVANAAPAIVGHAAPPTSPAAETSAPVATSSPAASAAQGAPIGVVEAEGHAPAPSPITVRADGYDPRDARGDRPDDEARLLATESVDSLLKHGLAELQEGRFEYARARFRLAVTKDPNRAEAYNGVGVSYYARGDFDEALAWYKRGLEADPRFGDAYYNIGCIYALEGHRALAFRYLRLASLDGYSEKEQLLQDPDLVSLRNDPEMAEIIDQMAAPKPSQPAPAPGQR